jgi:hypothetical protein
LGKLQDFGVAAWLLLAELIARETQNGKALGFVFFMKGTQTCVLRREASLARDVDDQTNLVLEAGQRHLLTGDGFHLQVVEFGHAVLLGFGRPMIDQHDGCRQRG